MYSPSTMPRPATKDSGIKPCPACGGLECLCRPRFFAGQLLTDEDLNRLDHYIREKHKLHNRYLQGVGVVCGLEVICHPCAGYVTVKAGYALSPCGDDIVVCKDDDVDICALIARCRERDRRDVSCDPPRPRTFDDCQDVEENWLLKICYEERASRGVMALRSSGASCARCGCSGGYAGACGCQGRGATGACSCGGGQSYAGSCGCGCQERTTGSRRMAAKAPPAQCEPTVTCETYRFEVCRAPQPDRATPTPGRVLDPGGLLTHLPGTFQPLAGEIVERYRACLTAIRTAIPGPPTDRTKASMYRWCCQVKVALQDLLERFGVHDCRVIDRLAQSRCPDPNQDISDAEYARLVEAEVQRLAVVGAELQRACLCSALLPPCPPPADDNCIILATVTVRRSDCRILRICNADYRQMAITLPALRYWLSAWPLEARLRQYLSRLCCAPVQPERVPIAGFRPRATAPGFTAATPGGTEATGAEAKREPILAELFARAWAGRDRTVDAYTLLLDTLGAVGPENQPLLSEVERALPLQAVLLNQLLFPTLGEFLPDAAAGLAQPATTSDVDALRAELAQLREQVARQEAEIERLRGPE